MIAMCTYSLKDSRAIDLLNVARAQDFTIARRNGEWSFWKTPAIEPAKLEIKGLKGGDVLAQLVTGATNKEAGRVLNISPRTIDFHRDIMRRLRAKNLLTSCEKF